MTAPAHLLQLHGVIVDLIYRVDAVPDPGGEAVVRAFDLAAGGGFNAMAAAKRSGLHVTYAGGVGSGPLGRVVCDALDAEGLACLRAPDPERDQGCCTVLIDRTGERTFVASAGAEGCTTDLDLQRIDPTRFGWTLISGYALYYPGSREGLTRWLGSDRPPGHLVFDPSPIIGSVPATAVKAALDRAHWVSANAHEACTLTDTTDPTLAAHRLAQGRAGGAVVRTGAEGCVVAWDSETRSVRGHTVRAIDTNGAGDTHVGAFIAGLARGQGPVEAARYANVAAALSTTQAGPATAPDLATIEETLRLRKAG